MSMARRSLSIALVTETYPPEVNGVAMTLGRLVAGIAARGHRVRIVRPRQRHERAGMLPDGQLLTPGMPIPRYPELRFGLPVARLLRRAWRAETPDVVHVATEGPLGLAALAAARHLDIPVISTFHTNFHSYTRHYGVGWLHGAMVRYLRWFHNRTAATLVPTPQLAGELAADGFRSVDVLARGVDTRLFDPARRSAVLRERWGAADDAPVCLVVGRMAPEKNLELALAAFAALRAERPRARLVFVGDGPLRAPLARRHPDCHYAGARHGEDLAAHYASADLFLFPSLTETYGNVVAEALASGLPVVAFDHAAAHDLIRDGENGWRAAPHDERAFIAAARRLAALPSTPARRAVCAASARHLDWERIHDRYVGVLTAVAADRPRRATGDAAIRFAPD